MKLRISLSQHGDEIKGTIETPADAAFVIESLALIVETVAVKWEVPVATLLEDI